MGQAVTYKEIMRAYEAAQNNAHNLHDRRLAYLYKTLPRVCEIDRELARIGLEWVRQALPGGKPVSGGNITNAPGDEGSPVDAPGVKDSLPNARTRYDALMREKAALLAAHNIPDNYLTDIYQCAMCQDTGYINTQSTTAERCACFKQKLIETGYAMSNLADVLARENFSTFDTKYYHEELLADEGLSPRKNIEHNRIKSERFVKNFKTKASNLLFHGPTGLGKTFLCHCIAKALLDEGNTVLYVTAPRLFKLIQTQQFNRSPEADAEEKLDAIQEADLLIIDDLGAEFSTIVTQSALFDVINQRLLDRRSVIISTNLTLDELEEHYTERIVSRLTGNYEWLKFFGDDIRVQQKKRSLV